MSFYIWINFRNTIYRLDQYHMIVLVTFGVEQLTRLSFGSTKHSNLIVMFLYTRTNSVCVCVIGSLFSHEMVLHSICFMIRSITITAHIYVLMNACKIICLKVENQGKIIGHTHNHLQAMAAVLYNVFTVYLCCEVFTCY